MAAPNANDLIKQSESQLVQLLTARIVAGAVASWPFIATFNLSPFLSVVVSLTVATFVKWGDLGVYFLGDSWLNTEEGKAYEKAQNDFHNLPKDASPADRASAEQAARDAFDRLMG